MLTCGAGAPALRAALLFALGKGPLPLKEPLSAIGEKGKVEGVRRRVGCLDEGRAAAGRRFALRRGKPAGGGRLAP